MLVVAAASKFRRPALTARALGYAGLPGGRGVVRGIAIGELMLGLACLFVPGPVLLTSLAGAYLVFAGFTARLLALGLRRVSCGCFGERDADLSAMHVVVNLTAAALCLLAATGDRFIGLASLKVPAWEYATALVGLASTAYAALALLTTLPAVATSFTEVEAP